MNINPINKANSSFKGLLTLSGPNKDKNIVVNTDTISTISYSHPYLDKKEDSTLGIGYKNSAMIRLNNDKTITTFMPIETVVDAYKKANEAGEYKLETKFDPVLSYKILSSI